MSIVQSEEPLSRHPVLRTSNREEFGHVLVTTYGATGFDVPPSDKFLARGNFVQLQDIAIGFSSSGSAASIDFPEANYARQQIALQGHAATTIGKSRTDIHARQSCVTSPGCAAKLEYAEGYEQLILRVGRAALERKLALILGAKPKGRLEFEQVSDLRQPYAQNLERLAFFFAKQINSEAVKLPPMALRQLQQAITVSFLYANRNSFSGLLEQDTKNASPWHVRRAEEYIEAHWDQPITITTLTEVTDHSARAIFKAFRQSRGYSPMAFAKRVRLRHAHEMLSAADPKTSVTGVAFACGFSNLGHFAKDYRETFKERPSDTLSRAKLRNLS